jgi:hypothetical protein
MEPEGSEPATGPFNSLSSHPIYLRSALDPAAYFWVSQVSSSVFVNKLFMLFLTSKMLVMDTVISSPPSDETQKGFIFPNRGRKGAEIPHHLRRQRQKNTFVYLLCLLLKKFRIRVVFEASGQFILKGAALERTTGFSQRSRYHTSEHPLTNMSSTFHLTVTVVVVLMY